jgi:antitoxin component of MazEF toxin-antitoxin module
MKWVRRLTRNGHSNSVSLPAQLLDHLRFRGGDNLLVELTERGTIEIRQVTQADLRTAIVSPMALSSPVSMGK